MHVYACISDYMYIFSAHTMLYRAIAYICVHVLPQNFFAKAMAIIIYYASRGGMYMCTCTLLLGVFHAC